MVADPPGDRPNDDDTAVRPEELDFTKQEDIVDLGDGRYIVSTGGSLPDDVEELEQSEPASADLSTAELRAELASRVGRVDSTYGFSVTAAFDGRVEQHDAFSDDLGNVFDDLVTWYASEVAKGTDPAEVIGILLLAGGRQVQFPRRALIDLFRARGISPDDSVSDLITALEGDGVRLPPEE